MSKLSELAHALHRKTMERRLKWDIQDDLSISINVGTNSISINRYWDANLGTDALQVSISNLQGQTIDSESFYSGEVEAKNLEELMVRARRDALRADETLDELLEKVKAM